MRNVDAVRSALRDVENAAEALETFLSTHAPQWTGYGRSISECANQLMEREVTRSDLSTLQDRAYEPFRGTFGSMHDLSFVGGLEEEYQQLRRQLGRALESVEAAVRE